MSRYLIIDTERIKNGECKATNPDGNEMLNLDKAILSPEETEAVFERVYNKGHEVGFGDIGDASEAREAEFIELKKTL